MRTHLSLLAGLVAAIALSGSSATVAGTLKCSSRHLSDADQAHLMAAMRSALPSVSIDSRPSVCRNPGSARAWLETKRQADPGGFDAWWALDCDRKQAAWSCDRPVQNRELKMQRPLQGTMRNLTVEFADDTSVEQARDLVGRVFDLFEADAPVPKRCDSTRNAWKEEKERVGPKPADIELGASISRDGRSITVLLSQSDLGFTFEPDSQQLAETSLKCWGVWVIVA